VEERAIKEMQELIQLAKTKTNWHCDLF